MNEGNTRKNYNNLFQSKCETLSEKDLRKI